MATLQKTNKHNNCDRILSYELIWFELAGINSNNSENHNKNGASAWQGRTLRRSRSERLTTEQQRRESEELIWERQHDVTCEFLDEKNQFAVRDFAPSAASAV